jgi:hypothetical protein
MRYLTWSFRQNEDTGLILPWTGTALRSIRTENRKKDRKQYKFHRICATMSGSRLESKGFGSAKSVKQTKLEIYNTGGYKHD